MMRWTLPVPSARWQASRHIGKMSHVPADFAPLGPALTEAPPLAIRADATYLVSGGLSGFGCARRAAGAAWRAAPGAPEPARGVGTPDAAAQLLEFDAQG